MTAETAKDFFESGVDFITSGNHIWDKREFRDYLETSDRVIRPANYPPDAPGKGHGMFKVDGVNVGVINLMGRVFMPPVDDPFRSATDLVEELRRATNVIVVDVHAEATSEKMAIGRFLDGKVSFVYGTHTHVQTADEQIFAGGTAYLSDLGMTGPTDSVLGMETSVVIDRFTKTLSDRFAVAKHGPKQLCGAIAMIDRETGLAKEIKRIFLRGVG